MLDSIPHQKICFYNLPTRGRAGIKLGDAWYVSNVSIIFDCSMLLFYLFWMFIGFTLHFYIIFGTNLLTGGLARIAIFLPVLVFRRKGISNKVQMEWDLRERSFWNKRNPEDLEWKSSNKWGGHEGARDALWGWACPPPSWAPRASTDLLLPPIYTHVPQKHPGAPRKPNSTAATFCIREIPSWSLRRCSTGGGIDHGGPLHHLQGLSNELWVVYHRTSVHNY